MDVGSSLTRPTQPVRQQLRRGSYLEALVPQWQQAEVGALLPGWFGMQLEAERSKGSRDRSEPSMQTKQRCSEQGLVVALGKVLDTRKMTKYQRQMLGEVTYKMRMSQRASSTHSV